MPLDLSLADYVKRRNGVALGARRSMRNMLWRSLGAGSFAKFWHYWNPIWGYYLASRVQRPLTDIMPAWLALLLTFAVSGLLHDIAVSLVKLKLVVFFTPWFVVMGALVLVSRFFTMSYSSYAWLIRAMLNIAQIVGSFFIVRYLLLFIGMMPAV